MHLSFLQELLSPEAASGHGGRAFLAPRLVVLKLPKVGAPASSQSRSGSPWCAVLSRYVTRPSPLRHSDPRDTRIDVVSQLLQRGGRVAARTTTDLTVAG